MQATTYAQALEDWLDGRFDLPRSRSSGPEPDDLFEVDASLTNHAVARAAQRGIEADLLPLLTIGGSIRPARDGCSFVYISHQDAREVGCVRLANLAAIVSADGVLVTTYRVERAPREWDPRHQRRRARRQRVVFGRELRRLPGSAA